MARSGHSNREDHGVEIAALAASIGVRVVRKLDHGEGQGAWEVRLGDGTPAVLKVDPIDTRPFTEALRVRNYPAPATYLAGDGYAVHELMPGRALDQATPAHVAHLLHLNELQRDVPGMPARLPWLEEMVTSITEGRAGYCELAPLRDANPALLHRLQTIAGRAEDEALDVPTDDIVHFDFSPLNILADGERITGVVDWQGATSGDATFDLVELALYTYDAAARDGLLLAARARTDPRALGVYAAHMVLRQVDWSLRHHDPAVVHWFTDLGKALLDDLGAG